MKVAIFARHFEQRRELFADYDMLYFSTRRIVCAVLAIALLSILALIREREELGRADVTMHLGSSSLPLNAWMQLCGFELYPNLNWQTVVSQHGRHQSSTGRRAMTVFLPFAVDNSLVPWGSEVDDSDFQDCPTSCVWVRNRDTSMPELRRNARCASQAHAVLFWLPLGHPYKKGDFGYAEGAEAIKSSGLIRSGNQVWVGVGTEPGMASAFQGTWSAFEHRFSWSCA